MIIALVTEKLAKYPDVTYAVADKHLEISAQTETGFRIWIDEHAEGCTVAFEGWHEKFSNADDALNCIAFGLSEECRLRVFCKGNTDYKWQLLRSVDGNWIAESETGLLLFPFWRRSVQRELHNDLIASRL